LVLGQIVGSHELDVVLQAGDVIHARASDPLVLGLVLLGALTKGAQFLFHLWLPHAMGRADSGVGLPALGHDGQGQGLPAGAVVDGVDRHTLHTLAEPLLDHGGVGLQAGRLGPDHRPGLRLLVGFERLQQICLWRQRARGLQPALLRGQHAQDRQLVPSKDTVSTDLAISLATAHAVQRLSILMHLDSPVCHGLPAQKSGKYGGLGKNRNAQA